MPARSALYTENRSRQTEIVFTASQLDLYADLVDHLAILEKDVGMQTGSKQNNQASRTE